MIYPSCRIYLEQGGLFMSNLNFVDQTINFKVIVKGVFFGIVFLLVVSVLMALFFSFFAVMRLDKISNMLMIINYLIVVYIGFYIAKQVNNNGWLNGGLGGLIYMGIIILVGFIALPFSIIRLILIMFSGLVGGSLGGMIGINF